MATQEHDQWRYLIIWEFRVRAGGGRFEKVYGPLGDWARFFARDDGFVRTELNHDLKDSRRYTTLDFWISEDAYDNYREQQASEYAVLEHEFKVLSENQLEIDKYDRLTKQY